MIPNQNILRLHRSRKPLIITLVVLFILLLGVMSYGIYCTLNYKYVNSIDDMTFENYLIAITTMFSCDFKLKLNAAVVKEILSVNFSLWWVYLSVAAIMFIYVTSRTRNDFKGMEHGSARWADEYVIREFKSPENSIPVAKDFYIPIDGSKTANLNEIVIGGSGAGKTYRKIKPDILQLNGSYVVTDPKGELYRDCAKMLKNHGYKVRVLNLINLNYSNSFNPFVYITSEQDIVNVSNLFMKNTSGEGEKEDFWSSSAGEVLTMLMTYLFKDKDEIKTFGRVVRLVNSVRYANNEIDMSCEFARMLNKHSSKYPNDVCTVTWNGLQGLPQETLASILKVLSTRLALWSTTDLDAITSTDEMDFDNIGKERTAIFLIIPAARNTYKVVCNIFYSQLFERLMRVAEKDCNGYLPQLVNCELDEFANIGEIPAFNETLSVVRSYNIRICIVLQGLAQLKAIYEKTYEAIIGNCDIFTVLGCKDNDTLKYISEKLDKITVRGDSRSFNRGSMNGTGGQDTEAYIERPLLFPAEIKRAIKPNSRNRQYGGACIVFVGYEDPFYLNKFDTPNHPLFEECGSKYPKYLHNNTYIENEYASVWEERLIHYAKIYEGYTLRENESKEEYAMQAQIESENNQNALAEEFKRLQPIHLPHISEPTEEEYAVYADEVDNQYYQPVADFYDDEYDDEDEDYFDDIAPIVAEINEGVGIQ